MTVQDILMGYEIRTGRAIMLSEHEENFSEFLVDAGYIHPGTEALATEVGPAAAWRALDQIGYYQALQRDWEAARDDDQSPLVVDRLEDLPK